MKKISLLFLLIVAFNLTSAQEYDIKGKNLEMYKKGVNFYASGNEPFWSLEISFDKYIKLGFLSGREIETDYVKGIKAADANITQYTLKSGKKIIIITLYEEKCLDDMSGEEFDYKVKIRIKNKKNIYKTYFGCGRYVPDFGLNGKWKIKEFLGDKDDASVTGRWSNSYLIIDAEQKRYSSKPECNLYNGGIRLEVNSIRFFDGVSTLMACPDMEKEREFMKGLKQVTSYNLKDNELTLFNPDKTIMRLVKDMNEHGDNKQMQNDSSKLYILHDIWVLESINGKEADKTEYMKGLPMIEIKINEMRFSGHSGCNNINGKIQAESEKISFSNVAMTRMSCKGNSEAEFIKALTDVNTYKIGKNRLILSKDGDILLVFKKVD